MIETLFNPDPTSRLQIWMTLSMFVLYILYSYYAILDLDNMFKKKTPWDQYRYSGFAKIWFIFNGILLVNLIVNI